eukprot:CAMPEP_0184478676 /NCGR_PEP_ID=MMETSP0113_2-20130426/646_1 /TAXON_ID=91329 /ORGANISM="Norrisiella sphaerica, Strain BC52" /LENGTH=99 /DNA_ID=CAMNT_0026856559 /DNA_START=130 /DNA_END=429 /DNA_ORIENTATION=+
MTRSSVRGHAASGPEPQGIVAKITSKDEYLVLSTFGGVAGILLLRKLLKSGSKQEAPAPAPASSPSSGEDGIPSVEDPAFAEWIGKDENFGKLFAQLDK